MDCRQAMNLISPRLDGTLAKGEAAALDEHLAACLRCRHEFELYMRISGTLKSFSREEVQAPPDICSNVMARIRTERRSALSRLPAAWRRAAVAAAAVILLAGGSAGVTAGLQFAGRDGNMVGYVDPSGQLDYNRGDSKGTTANPPPAIDGDNPLTASGGGMSGVTDSTPPQVKQSGNSGSGQEGSGHPGSGEINKPSPEAAGPAPPAEGPAALLSGPMKVINTRLKVSVEDLEAARARVLAIALPTGEGTTAQDFPGNVDGKRMLVMRLVVEPQEAPGLISGLAGLGTLIDRQEESRDLTAPYNETLAQYRDLQVKMQTAGDAGERQQLTYRATGLKQQLDAWQAEAGKQVIVLWLEEK